MSLFKSLNLYKLLNCGEKKNKKMKDKSVKTQLRFPLWNETQATDGDDDDDDDDDNCGKDEERCKAEKSSQNE